MGRRWALELGASALLLALAPPLPSSAASSEWAPAVIRPELAPDQRLYDPTDPQLRAAAQLLQDALNAQDVRQEEALWTRIIKEYGGLDSNWVPDLVGRAWGNRGNARSRQGRLQEALADYNESIRICPWSVDPVLNRGVIMEALDRFDEAIADYKAVLAAAPDDPAAFNNLGNAYAGLGDWEAAAENYGRATQLAPAFAFARENRALALYQLGQDNAAIKEMRSLARKFPDSFPDVRAALTAALWEAGLQAEAEAEWQRCGDPRYRDRAWLRRERRWPPRLIAALEAFLDIRGVGG